MNCRWMSFVCLFVLPPRLSSVSVVFDFNASLNDAAPVTKISLTIDMIRKERSELLITAFCVFFLLSSQLR